MTSVGQGGLELLQAQRWTWSSSFAAPWAGRDAGPKSQRGQSVQSPLRKCVPGWMQGHDYLLFMPGLWVT